MSTVPAREPGPEIRVPVFQHAHAGGAGGAAVVYLRHVIDPAAGPVPRVGADAVLGLEPVEVGQGQIALIGLVDAAHGTAGPAQQQAVGGEEGHLGVVGDDGDVVGHVVAQDAVGAVALYDLVIAEELKTT